MSTTSPPPEGPSGPEYLEQGGGEPVPPSSSGGSGRRTPLVAAGAVVLLAAAGAGTWAAVSFFGSGTQPAEALPADTLAYASVDLDPSGSQKIEAVRTLNKFPAFKEEFGLNAEDDLRRVILEEALSDCDSVDYAQDVEPWLGSSFAVAAVDAGEEQPSVVGVLAVSDAAAAEDGLAALATCGDEDSGYTVEGDWAYLAETDEIAQQVADDTGDATLADDTGYQDWTAEVGDPGVATMYAAPGAGAVIADLMASEMGAQGASATAGSGAGFATAEMAPEIPEEMRKAFEDFGGGAATIRFADGGVELELAGEVPKGVGTMLPSAEGASADLVGTLPVDTAFAYGLALPDNWTQTFMDMLASYGLPQQEIDRGLAQAEAQTGLSLPEDLEALLGEQVALAFSGGLDLEQLMNSGDPSALPFGVKVRGDADEVNRVVDTLGQRLGMPEMFETETDGDMVAWSMNPDYRSSLAGDGGLGGSETFQDVVPEADRSSAVMFVDFDAGDWLTILSMGDQKVQENLEPLSALGISSRVEGRTTRGLVRLTTD